MVDDGALPQAGMRPRPQQPCSTNETLLTPDRAQAQLGVLAKSN